MAKKIGKTQLIKDFRGGKTYAEIASRHKCSIGTIAYRLRKLGLKRGKQNRSLFSAEEKDFIRSLIKTYRGRKQLFAILKDK